MSATVTSIRIERDMDVAHARRTARLTAESAGAGLRDQTRFATAVSEIARNALQYAKGGMVDFSFDRSGGNSRLIAKISDQGKGIDNLEAILAGRHRSTTGLGLGVKGSRQLVDEFDLSTCDTGTTATLILHLADRLDPSSLSEAAAENLAERSKGNPLDELTQQNRDLRDALAQQEFLLRELHHRTKNNLAVIQSLATMQARNAKSKETKLALTTFAGRIAAFAAAHNFLQKAEDVNQPIDLKRHLLDLTNRLGKAFGSGKIKIACRIKTIRVDADMAVELGLVVNELVTNSVKHAFGQGAKGGSIIVSAWLEDNMLFLKVKDDGEGLENPLQAFQESQSLGWRVIESSARKIGGKLDVDGSDGLSVTLTAPMSS